MWPNPQETFDLVTLTEEILNGKLFFLCSDSSLYHLTIPAKYLWKVLRIYIFWINKVCQVFWAVAKFNLICKSDYKIKGFPTFQLNCKHTFGILFTIQELKNLKKKPILKLLMSKIQWMGLGKIHLCKIQMI